MSRRKEFEAGDNSLFIDRRNDGEFYAQFNTFLGRLKKHRWGRTALSANHKNCTFDKVKTALLAKLREEAELLELQSEDLQRLINQVEEYDGSDLGTQE